MWEIGEQVVPVQQLDTPCESKRIGKELLQLQETLKLAASSINLLQGPLLPLFPADCLVIFR